MVILISILTLFSSCDSGNNPPPSKTDLLTSGTQKSWYIYTKTPDGPCGSASDDSWIFFAYGTFEYNHGTVTEDQTKQCSDFVNLEGTWQFTNNETFLTITALHEKGNAANTISSTLLQGEITLLDSDRLVVTTTNPSTNTQITVEFRKK